ncbi:hypothetical protein PSYMO_37961, partial [Pseudomonas amygdali pv. mori str. 301020]
ATYRTIIKVIAVTVRYGYRTAYDANPEQIKKAYR